MGTNGHRELGTQRTYDKRGIGKQRINLTSLGKWMAEQGLGGIVRRKNC